MADSRAYMIESIIHYRKNRKRTASGIIGGYTNSYRLSFIYRMMISRFHRKWLSTSPYGDGASFSSIGI